MRSIFDIFMAGFRLLIRFTLGFTIVSSVLSLTGLVLKIFGGTHHTMFRIFNLWKKIQLSLFNVRIEFRGKIPDRAAIIMPNHRSYVDILLIPVEIPVVFVAKSSVQNWPIVGWGGNAMNTVWVDRSDKDSRKKTRTELKNRLENGESVIVFPEGTTTRGPGIAELKPGMFHTVAEGGFTIYAVAIEYKYNTIAFVGNDLFLTHFAREFSKPGIYVKVEFSEPFTGTDGEKLRQQVGEWLTLKTAQFRKEWDQN